VILKYTKKFQQSEFEEINNLVNNDIVYCIILGIQYKHNTITAVDTATIIVNNLL